MNPAILARIEANYGFKIAACQPAPRQFVAETYYLRTSGGERYFCKLVDKRRFIPGLIQSLPVLEAMHAGGIERINYPIRGSSGLYFMHGGTLVALFNYVEGVQRYDYSEYTFGALIAEIHAVTSRINPELARETFEFEHREEYDRIYQDTLCYTGEDDVLRESGYVLRTFDAEIRHFAAEYQRLSGICKTFDVEQVITHGDAPGNVLAKSNDDICLIDWDSIQLAPAEWDTWLMDQHPRFLEGYRSVRPGFRSNPDIRAYCVYKYYFQSLMHYFDEIVSGREADYRRSMVHSLHQDLIRGWMMPKLREINPGYPLIEV